MTLTPAMIDWHRLFGLALCDLFAGSPWIVELEKDLSLKKQLLDVVIVRRGPGTFQGRLPDGLDELADHNLLTYKSLREPLDDWALKELTGHYVNYRKQLGDSLLPEGSFRLYGITTRFPEKLADQVRMDRLREGIYEVQRGTDHIVVVVLNQIPLEEHNSVWHLFSGVPRAVEFGATHYQQHTPDGSAIFNQLYQRYQLEGVPMPYTMEDFRRDVAREYLDLLSPQERLKGLPPEERLKGLPPEERLKGLPPEEFLRRLPLDVIEDYLRRMQGKANGTGSGKENPQV
jgi:hypothetical protein